MIFFYRLLYLLAKHLVLFLKPFLGAHLRSWIELRDQKIPIEKNVHACYWFHASSGEIEYCKSIIRKLKEAQPASKIVVTYSSPSAEKLFGNISGYVDAFIPLCWDQSGPVQELLERLQPQYLLFSRTDLWPELIYQANKKRVPMGLFSFSPKFNFLNRVAYKYFLKDFAFVSCLDTDLSEELTDLVPGLNSSSEGDTRFDQVFFRLSQASKISFPNQDRFAVFGSTWEQDEAVLFQTLNWFKERNYKLIISPHDVSEYHINRISNELKKLNVTCQILSEHLRAGNYEIQVTSDVLLIDKIGYLADCYRFAEFAFVGGSFKDKVHSIMEPLCCGLKVAVGPFYKNSPEGVKYLNRFVFRGRTAPELVALFEKIKVADKSLVTNEMQKNLNASQRVLDLILNSSAKT